MEKKLQQRATARHSDSAPIGGVGIWLKALREAAKLSQQELAIKIGVNRGAVIRWEAGECSPAAKNLIAIGNEFGYSVAKEAWINAGVKRELLYEWEQSLPPGAVRLTRELFPFAAGDLVGVENAGGGDLWRGLNALVAVRFETYPAELRAEYREREDMSALRANASDDEKRFIPDEDGMIPVYTTDKQDTPEQAAARRLRESWVQAGWLLIQFANDPYFSMAAADPDYRLKDTGPWRLVLQGAGLAGAHMSLPVPLMKWNTGAGSRRYRGIRLPGKEVLGRVVSWQIADRLGLTAGCAEKLQEVEEIP